MGSKYTSGFTHCKKTSKDIKITPVLRSCHWAKGDWLTLNCLFNLKQKPFICNFWNCLAKGALRIRIYISTDMYLDLTTIQYCYTKLLAPRLQKPVPKCKVKVQKIMTNYNVILWKTKMRTTDVTPMTCPFLWTTNTCIGLIYKKCNKIMSHRHLKKVTYTKSNITYYVMYMSLT